MPILSKSNFNVFNSIYYEYKITRPQRFKLNVLKLRRRIMARNECNDVTFPRFPVRFTSSSHVLYFYFCVTAYAVRAPSVAFAFYFTPLPHFPLSIDTSIRWAHNGPAVLDDEGENSPTAFSYYYFVSLLWRIYIFLMSVHIMRNVWGTQVYRGRWLNLNGGWWMSGHGMLSTLGHCCKLKPILLWLFVCGASEK